jgi:hypothetical protein
MLIDIFGRIESFFVRLEIYTGVPLTLAMTEKMVQITVEILAILATATKEMEQSRASGFDLRLMSLEANIGSENFLKKVAGRTDLEDGLKKLEKLTNEEIAMASARLLKVTDTIDNKVMGVGDTVRGVDEKVQVVSGEVQFVQGEVQVVKGEVQAIKGGVQFVSDNIQAVDEKLQTIADGGQSLLVTHGTHRRHLQFSSFRRQGNRHGTEISPSTNGRRSKQREAFVIGSVFAYSRVSNMIAGNHLRESLRKWQSPPDMSTNHNIAGDRQHKGTSEWLFESDKFEKWKAKGSLLWIHGKRTFLLPAVSVIS